MNYITQINAFYSWLIEHPLPAASQALWHRLMAYCNQFGWKREFSIANSRLMGELGLAKTSFERARDLLAEQGHLVYRKGRGSACGSYTMLPFVSQTEPDFDTQTGRNPGTMRAQTGPDTGTLDKQDQTKQEKTISVSPGQKNYAEHVRLTAQEYGALVESYGEQDTARLIELLDNYKGASGKNYCNDYRAILSWCVSCLAREKARRPHRRRPRSPEGEHSFDMDQLERMAFEITYGREEERE